MPRARREVLYELAGQWISREPGRRVLYRYFTDAGNGRTTRRSLGTNDLEKAKLKFATLVVTAAPQTPNSLVSAVLVKYFTEHTDKLPSKKQARNAGKVLLKCWGKKIRVNAITETRQKEFAEWSIRRGFALTYVEKNMSVLKAALNHASVNPPSKIVTAPSKMRERWGLAGKPPRKVLIPTDDDMVRIWRAEMPERLRRWMIISVLTHCRPEAALDLAPGARRRDVRLLDLNPEGREQNKKYRPIVRDPRVLSAYLDKWERDGLEAYGGRYCGYSTIEGVKSALERLREDVGLPGLSAYSFRHKVTSVLRRARVSEDQVALQMGHKRRDLRTTAGYGEFDPDYLKDAARALDAWFLRLRAAVKSHTKPTVIRERSKLAA